MSTRWVLYSTSYSRDARHSTARASLTSSVPSSRNHRCLRGNSIEVSLETSEKIVLKALRKHPENRFSGCGEFARQIDLILGAASAGLPADKGPDLESVQMDPECVETGRRSSGRVGGTARPTTIVCPATTAFPPAACPTATGRAATTATRATAIVCPTTTTFPPAACPTATGRPATTAARATATDSACPAGGGGGRTRARTRPAGRFGSGGGSPG